MLNNDPLKNDVKNPESIDVSQEFQTTISELNTAQADFDINAFFLSLSKLNNLVKANPQLVGQLAEPRQADVGLRVFSMLRNILTAKRVWAIEQKNEIIKYVFDYFTALKLTVSEQEQSGLFEVLKVYLLKAERDEFSEIRDLYLPIVEFIDHEIGIENRISELVKNGEYAAALELVESNFKNSALKGISITRDLEKRISQIRGNLLTYIFCASVFHSGQETMEVEEIKNRFDALFEIKNMVDDRVGTLADIIEYVDLAIKEHELRNSDNFKEALLKLSRRFAWGLLARHYGVDLNDDKKTES